MLRKPLTSTLGGDMTNPRSVPEHLASELALTQTMQPHLCLWPMPFRHLRSEISFWRMMVQVSNGL